MQEVFQLLKVGSLKYDKMAKTEESSAETLVDISKNLK